MIIFAKLELTLLIIVPAHVHIVVRHTRVLWLTLIVLFLSQHSMNRVLVRTAHSWFLLILLLSLDVNISFMCGLLCFISLSFS